MSPNRRSLMAAAAATVTALMTGRPLAAQTLADPLADLPWYVPQTSVEGLLRLWGNPYIPELVQAWQTGFQRHHPGVRFNTRLLGTEAAMAGLYAGIADVAFIGREPYAPELQAFEDWFGYPPTGVKITSGSYATQHKTFALMVYVHRDNPLAGMDLAQLDAIYGVERRRGAPQAITHWGQLGLSGAWADRPIKVYGYDFDTGMAGFFRLTVLKNSERWNPALVDLRNGRTPAGEVINAGTYILDAVARDPAAIGFANVLFENPGVRRIALAAEPGGDPVEPTPDNAWRRRWPLTRYSTAFVDRPPGQPLKPLVREFLRYVLSRDGMDQVVRDAAFLPLDQATLAAQRQLLD